MAKKFFLSLLLLVAGITHLLSPNLFVNALPDFLIFKKQIIYLSGFFEIALSLGLLAKKYQYVFAEITANYFIFLIPIHIYVAMNGIEMFHISSKTLLWMRLILQYPLILCAFSLTKNPWVIEQLWRNVLFIHYKIDPKTIEHLVPFKLDLFEGQAVLSIVPFYMDKIRFPYLPAIPKVSSLWELNLRTYVEVDGVKGIYFFTLETDSKIGEILANKLFFLPYRYSKIEAKIKDGQYYFNHQREKIKFEMRAVLSKNETSKSLFDLWATERYSLFTKYKNTIFRGIVMHDPWNLFEVEVNLNKNNLLSMINLEHFKVENSQYSDRLLVRFKPFLKKVSEYENSIAKT